jgi:hypothetical protein
MPKVFLTPFLIAALLLLPSCSSGEMESNACDEVSLKFVELSEISQKAANYDEKRYASLNAIYYALENKECFSSEIIASLRAKLVTWQ